MIKMDDKTNRLANDYLKSTSKFITNLIDEGRIIEMTQDDIWELSKKLAIMAQGRKSFEKFYNSKEARDERNKSL